MGSFSRRLAAVESRMAPRESSLHGSYEIHWLAAWPDCKDTEGIQRCEEHAPTCGVRAARTQAPGRQVLILRGGPWLGLD